MCGRPSPSNITTVAAGCHSNRWGLLGVAPLPAESQTVNNAVALPWFRSSSAGVQGCGRGPRTDGRLGSHLAQTGWAKVRGPQELGPVTTLCSLALSCLPDLKPTASEQHRVPLVPCSSSTERCVALLAAGHSSSMDALSFPACSCRVLYSFLFNADYTYLIGRDMQRCSWRGSFVY
jgi:hypothetical protein